MIQTELTPNPDSLKFLSEKTISAAGTEEFQKLKKNKLTNQFVEDLLNFKGVELILLGEKFLSVKKTKEVSWSELEPILKSEKKSDSRVENKNETINKIIEVLNTKIRPAVARDGGDIKFRSFDKGVVKVELQGSCSGCPSSLMTLKQGVQNLLKHYVKEVNSVEAIQ